ncbi:MAG: 3-hydroxyacyl-CoA dehydrogenase family protein [Thermoleophilaceae bacterium]
MNERLGIVGSGAIASGLAHAASDHGDLILWARSEESAERVTADVPTTIDLAHLADRTFVIEAVVEDAAVKRTVLAELGRVLGDDAVIATTTSSLPVAELAQASRRPDRFVAFHVFNPVERMKLVELAFPPEATSETKQRAHDLCDHLDKVAVEVPSIPGFVVNRLLFPYLFAAVRMLDLGMDPRAIDTCMKLGAGHPMGPLALLDFVGLDVAAAIGEEIGEEVPKRLLELVDDGHLGKKTGAGFYEY